jgi:diguanylate cyclase (GGDEF)-like protein/PAS domain S-box-containing protein
LGKGLITERSHWNARRDRPGSEADVERETTRHDLPRVQLDLDAPPPAPAVDSELRGRLAATEALASALFEGSPTPIVLVDEDHQLLRANAAFCEFVDRSAEELEGTDLLALTHPSDVAKSTRAIAEVLAGAERSVVEKRYVRPDGTAVWGRIRISLMEGADGGHVLLGVVEDISETKRHEARLRFDVLHDPLTRLPNRTLVIDRLDQALHDATESRQLVAVLHCDLDHLRVVNEVHGHAVGDEFLRAVARRIESALRDHDMVGRLGGDEFAVVAERVSTPTEVLGLTGRILDAVRQPLRIGTAVLAPSLSIGVAYSQRAGQTAPQLLADADAALNAAKRSGRGSWRLFEESQRTWTSEHLALRTRVGAALTHGELELHYQPIVRLADRVTVGYEALLRWRHPERGLLTPESFLDVIVDSEYETPVTDWVLSQATTDAAHWPDGSTPTISVNLTVFQLARTDLPRVVASALERSGLPPARLIVEVTEDRFLERAEGVAQLTGLRELGVRIAIDDFGTGFAGLGYVQRLPIDTIKIDRSFVSLLPSHATSGHIVRAIFDLATACDLRVVAEGVETAEQLDALAGHGVLIGQGHLFGRAAPFSSYLPR